MDENLGSSTSKNILRWLLFLPTAILVFFLPFFFFYFFLGFMLEGNYYPTENLYPQSYPISLLCIFYITLFSSFFLFVHTGSSVAPSSKKTVAIVLSLILITPLLLYFYIAMNSITGVKMDFALLDAPAHVNYAIISGIIGIFVANLTRKRLGVGKYLSLFFIFLILVFGSLYFFNTKDNSISNEGKIEIESPKIEKNTIVVGDPNDVDFYTQELKKVMDNCVLGVETTIRAEEINLLGEETKYEGLLWIDNEAELIKNYSVVNLEVELDNTKRAEIKEGFEQCVGKVSSFLLSENFVKNNSNSYDNSMEGHSINRNIAFEKQDIKLRLRHSDWGLKISFGDIKTADTPEVFQEIYPYADPEKDFSFNVNLHTVYNDYALLTIAGGITAWDTIFKRNTIGEWEQIKILYQYRPPCEEFVEANIPPELFDNAPTSFTQEIRKECIDKNNEPRHYNEYMRER